MRVQTLPDSRISTTQLAERVMSAYTELHDLKYVVLDPNLRIVHASPNIETVLSEQIPHLEGVPLWRAFWEFAGVESALNDILDGQETSYQLDHVCRTCPDGISVYLRFWVEPLWCSLDRSAQSY